MTHRHATIVVLLLSCCGGTMLSGCGAPKAAPATADSAPAAYESRAAPAAASSYDEQSVGSAEEREDDQLAAIEDIEAAFAASAGDLDRMLGDARADANAEAAPLADSAADAAQGRPRPAAAAPKKARRPDICELACRALGSMRRSASRLCELTGDDDERCGRVRERVSGARGRVANACPDCEAAEP